MARELIHTGSVKNVFQLDNGKIEFEFSDRISVFDKLIPNTIPGKGRALNDMACHWFEVLTEIGVHNHFIERTGDNSMMVEPVKIIHGRDNIKADGSTNHLVPLECILRHFVAGSLWDRLQKGKVTKEDLGFGPGDEITKGMRLKTPMFEVSTKLEPVDRMLDFEEAKYLSQMDDAGIANLRDTCIRIDANSS